MADRSAAASQPSAAAGAQPAALAFARRAHEEDKQSALECGPDLLDMLSRADPTIPDEVIQYFLDKSGCKCDDVRVRRMIALAAQKFVHDIAHDAKQHYDMRADKKRTRTVLKMEDLQAALEEHGINVLKPEYFVDTQ